MCTAAVDHFGYQGALHQFVSAMQRCDGGPPPGRRNANREAVMRVREFRAFLGVSPYRYLQCRRLERAGQLLRSGLGMAAAAHETGFADQSHFDRVFRRAFGTTPLAWRRSGQPRTIIL